MKNGMWYDTRDWDARYDTWKFDRDNQPRPGPHPDPNHPWNTNPEMYEFGDPND